MSSDVLQKMHEKLEEIQAICIGADSPDAIEHGERGPLEELQCCREDLGAISNIVEQTQQMLEILIERHERYKAYAKEWVKNNKEKVEERCKRYYQNNKEKILKQKKEYYQRNKEPWKRYYEDNKERLKAYRREFYQKNREKILEKAKEYYRKNKKGE